MRSHTVSRTLALLAVLLSMPHEPRVRAAEAAPVIVELFTSEGCSSCPPADALLQQLVNTQPVAGVQIVALGEHVDYWDQQGWKDRFSSAALTNRQQGYAQALNVESIYTPQMVVDGRVQLVGSDAASARRAIGQELSVPRGTVTIALEPRGDRVNVTLNPAGLAPVGRGQHAEVVVAVTEDGLSSDVRRGENHGRVLSHVAVVRQLTTIGDAGAGPLQHEILIDPSWRRDRLKVVAFVQESRSRRIMAAGAVALQSPRR